VDLSLGSSIASWSPDHPVVYRLRLLETEGDRLVDAREISWGFKDFRVQDKRFYLNGEPIELRGGVVAWHRFLRNPEAKTLAFSPQWFSMNVLLRLKSHGANMLRFNLGLPPESLLDRCDQEGMIVEVEWPFFHGINASQDSMREQWHEWLDAIMRHPSVMIVQPWNETEGDVLKVGQKIFTEVLADYPPFVVAFRDTTQIHKFWWSMFENLGLYYDSADQFDRPVMVEEFGGNYLNQQGDPDLHPAVRAGFLRFLGRKQTRALRLEFLAESNARVAEYWRRIGVAGLAPFCVLGSPEDGSSWFLGHLEHPQPMPVWNALTAAFSPQSVSLNVWDRNYVPSQRVEMPLFFFNDSDHPALLKADVRIVNLKSGSAAVSAREVDQDVPAHGRVRTVVSLMLPAKAGNWRFEAQLLNRVPGVTHPIISSWMFRTLSPLVPGKLAGSAVGVSEQETELRQFLTHNGLKPVSLDDTSAKVILGSTKTWDSLAHSPELRRPLNEAINRGVSIVLLDIGPRDLGQGYRAGTLGPLQGAPQIPAGGGYSQTQDLFSGIKVTFDQVAEPESHIQPGPYDDSLWKGLPIASTWIWNGLRGGLIAPAADMEVSGLTPQAFVAEWVLRGASAEQIASGSYYAYQLADSYAFSSKPDDAGTIKRLRALVNPALATASALGKEVLNLSGQVKQTDIAAKYRSSSGGQAQHLLILSTCGKDLQRNEIVKLIFGARKGNVILSQALTAGRLIRGVNQPGLYGIRYDPAAEQFVLNMLAEATAQ
jgi:hypothetical protein